jgi:diadenosine tetraphosphate (Ap4A) HIT family hydrolase
MEKIKGCSFCFPSNNEKILKIMPHFYVVPSIGSIVEGYVLINMKYHLPSFGCLDPSLLDEFLLLKENVRKALESVFGRGCIFYEHGRVGTSLRLLGDDKISHHAHLHCVAINVDLLGKISEKYQPLRLNAWCEVIQLEKYYKHYLYYEDNDKNMFFFPVDNYPKPQFLRSLLAIELNDPEAADWREKPNWENIAITYEKLLPYLNSSIGGKSYE